MYSNLTFSLFYLKKQKKTKKKKNVFNSRVRMLLQILGNSNHKIYVRLVI